MRESQNGNHGGTATAMEGELMPATDRGGFVESYTRGEVDTQIATARRYPRSVKAFKEKALSYATLDEEAAASCFYVLPARKGGDGKSIEGPSARLAEIVAASWGNMRAQASVIEEDEKFITARGVCWDLENNVAISKDVKRRITDKNGRRYSDDMIVTTGNAACSIALRNAVFSVVPGAMTKPVYEACRRIVRGDATTLAKRRGDMVGHFGKLGVPLDRLLASIERASIEDITIDDIVSLRGLYTAIKDGDTSIDEAFPAPQSDKPNGGGSKSDKLAESLAKKEQKPEKPPESPEAPTEPETPTASGALADLWSALESAKTTAEAGKVYQDFTAGSASLSESDRTKGKRFYTDRCEALKPAK